VRDIRLDNITQAAVASFAGVPDARRRELLQQLVQYLHDYARATQLTHEEWRAALAFLHRTGDISSDSRSEFSLLSDVLGLSSLVDLLASKTGVTPGSVLGPFHTAGSPWCDNPADLTAGNPGEVVLLRGRVLDAQGASLPQATLDFWQNAANGLYWQMDASQPQDNLRCRLRADDDGRFAIRTVRPQPYQIPTDGPVWHDVMGPAGRSAWRPAHYHLIVQAPGHRTLVTEIFDADDPCLDGDAVFGVRAALVRRYQRMSGIDVPVMDIDIVLGAQPV
jgi:protocatechuate 3,4-dioxygenase beta subunit